MNDTGKCMKIFCDLLDAMELAEKLGSKELFELLEQIGYEVADVLDKKNEVGAKNE